LLPQVHPVLRGERDYLRALRAAEMAAWEAGLPISEVHFKEARAHDGEKSRAADPGSKRITPALE